jgi:creatinine amidohydrolase/Fe(II)-dependent formamide hydrolase-like protein
MKIQLGCFVIGLSVVGSIAARSPGDVSGGSVTRQTAAMLVRTGNVQNQAPTVMTPDPNGRRPIEAADTLFIEDMTWMEVRDAMRAGKDTVIVATGGIEQNGPYLVAGKHNIVLRAMTGAIAKKLGNALVAPIVGFVPEGQIDPPTEHMKYPSTVGVSEETYQSLLADICSCFRTHGFKNIILIGDSGGNQTGMKAVAERLNGQWQDKKSRVYYIPEYFDYPGVKNWLESQGLHQKDEGWHDDFAITAIMMTVDPTSVRARQRMAANKFRINGVELAPVEKTIEWGKKIIDYRADATVKAIRAAIGS